ncbi:winged helix-turn-helix domain-containing protein [Streptomyces hesseae]|uniref:Winged helix-turn-helix domain-containing protein n=1 Tax=Streptomyces hesseae TaxID=3075519 RepID=A0ABU2SSJ2_9ACTN|nr:winged helix-turn-helix domain-containing protein [Streptomyces sp. DSM 40473]MDT0451959.1 winged helix-turn-helix domain-containing protein [Streptomyces sp. DSM 40473]
MSLPRDSHTPPYRLVADEIRKQIRSGRIKPGERVPSSRDLEAEYEIANMTARSALRLLRDEGLIYSTPGRGNFVCDPLPPEPSTTAGTSKPEPADHMPTPEYEELSQRLDAVNARLDNLLEVFQQLAGITEKPKKK